MFVLADVECRLLIKLLPRAVAWSAAGEVSQLSRPMGASARRPEWYLEPKRPSGGLQCQWVLLVLAGDGNHEQR